MGCARICPESDRHVNTVPWPHSRRSGAWSQRPSVALLGGKDTAACRMPRALSSRGAATAAPREGLCALVSLQGSGACPPPTQVTGRAAVGLSWEPAPDAHAPGV